TLVRFSEQIPFPSALNEQQSLPCPNRPGGRGWTNGKPRRASLNWQITLNQISAYSVMPPNRVHVAAGQYLYCTSPSTSPRATKPVVRLSRELFRLSPSTKHIPSGTFALG